MGLFGTKKDDKPVPEIAPPHVPSSQVRTAEPPKPGARVGIDHAIELMRSLPTERNVELVVTVLKATLESLGIRVADIVADAAERQRELEGRKTRLEAEIQALEKEIAQRTDEIARIEAAHAETSKVRGYLEADEVQLVSVLPDPPAAKD